MSINDILKERASLFKGQASSYRSKASKLSWARFAVFLLIITNGIIYLNDGYQAYYLIPLAGLLALFIWLIIKHKAADYQYQINHELSMINEEELQRTDLDFKAMENGLTFDEEDHPYTNDLDVFGEHSLFQMINRSPLVNAQKVLAKWLKKKSDTTTIRARQDALKELKNKTDWRQHLTATARVIVAKQKKKTNQEELNQLFNWLKKPTSTKGVIFMQFCGYFLALTNLITLLLVAFEIVSYHAFLVSFLTSMIALSYSYSRCLELGEQLNKSHIIIKTYYNLIVAIEEEEFESSQLKLIRNVLYEGKASASIKELDHITYRFSSRANIFYGFIDPLFMLDYQLLVKAIKWKNAQSSQIEKWFDVVDEMSALVSIGGFYYLNQDYSFPTISSKGFILKGTEIGHPLIDKNQRVNNDFDMGKEGDVGIITGSNMSGKSTFERTVGVNIVLAQLGAPVCAKSFEIAPMEIFTSMRTKDNLEESTSSFYAELKRIKQLINHVEANEVTFYVIDEVLKGTNSEDRHKGAVSIANQLSGKKCFGLISTHDLSLSKLTEENPHIVNYSFNSTINGDQIIFDYKLTDGPCKSFNASKLMENMGIIPKSA